VLAQTWCQTIFCAWNSPANFAFFAAVALSLIGSTQLRYKAPMTISDLVGIWKESGMFLYGRI
jgi:hypothetical protein